MRRISLPLYLLAALLVCLIHVAPAQAQATRTWVSGVGDDANPCSRTAPCKTFAGAISKTAISGVINCLDPGGFGALTITKSITLDCHETIGSVLVAGTNGITINASNSTVILRGIDLQGIGSGLIGISIVAAATVSLEDVVVTQFTQQGINDARTGGGTQLFVRNSIVRNNTQAGVAASAGATNNVLLENVFVVGNGSGVTAATGNNVIVNRSVVSGNTTTGISVASGAQMFVNYTEISANATGLQNAGSSTTLANSDIYFNTTTGISGVTGSYGTNRIYGNGTAGTIPNVGPVSTEHSQN